MGRYVFPIPANWPKAEAHRRPDVPSQVQSTAGLPKPEPEEAAAESGERISL